jgi:glycosyltransferase involved in cell wall biosynthesis
MLTAHPPGRGSGSAVRGRVAYDVLRDHFSRVDVVSFAAEAERAFAVDGALLIPRPGHPSGAKQLAALRYGSGLYFPERAAQLIRRVEQAKSAGSLLASYDLVWCHASLMARAGERFAAGTRILDIDNVAAEPARQLAKESASVARRLYRRAAAAAVGREERRRAGHQDHVLVTSEEERRRLGRVAAPVHVLPNTVPDPGPPADPGASDRRALFVGSLDYGPNIEAVAWLAGELWPAIRDRDPQARLIVAGRSPGNDVRAMCERAGNELIADAPTLDDLYRSARVVLAPTRSGGGVGRIKLLEALAYGTAVVATSQAVDGLPADDLGAVAVARDGAAFVDATAGLLRDAGAAAALGARARRAWEAHHTPAVARGVIVSLLESG